MDFLYLVATVLFIVGIKRLSRVRTARSGNQLAAVGMLLAIITVLFEAGALNWWVLILGLIVGSGIGWVSAKRVPMTAMPEMVGAFNGMGGLASTFVALVYLIQWCSSPFRPPGAAFADGQGALQAITLPLTVIVGMVTFTGSFVAYFKLQDKKLVHPLRGSQRHGLHIGLVVLALVFSLWLVSWGSSGVSLFFAALLLTLVSGALGVFLVLPIGGADMPVVISLLNSYSGVAGALSGFVIHNQLLVVAGALVGASGLILTRIMCKAMNRSLGNVLLGGLGDAPTTAGSGEYSGVKSTSPEEVAMLFDGAASCIMVPGYGLAVAQAQHAMRDLGVLLEKRGCNVRYAIHPVAGRMPGHMNVLLAEADVPYEKLFEMDAINADFKNTDVVLVVGANDVVNPAARQQGTPISGMPILDVDQARTVVVVKRSLSPGYAGIKNPLFEGDNTLMLFMDAKVALEDLVKEVKSL